MNENCKESTWDIKVKAKQKTRFKASADLTEKVNINVDINEELDENSELNSIAMEIEREEREPLKIKLKSKKKPRFKAGAELSGAVNRFSVDLDEVQTEEEDNTNLTLKLDKETDSGDIQNIELNLKKRNKTRFKAGADLTDKVNLAVLDITEEIDEDVQTLEITLVIKSQLCSVELPK